jgi:hypothetical protein
LRNGRTRDKRACSHDLSEEGTRRLTWCRNQVFEDSDGGRAVPRERVRPNAFKGGAGGGSGVRGGGVHGWKVSEVWVMRRASGSFGCATRESASCFAQDDRDEVGRGRRRLGGAGKAR